MNKCDECRHQAKAQQFEYMNTTCYECKFNPNRWDNFSPKMGVEG